MKVIECATNDRTCKESRNLWHVTEDKEVTLCGYNQLYLFTSLITLTEKRKNLCPDCLNLARKSRD